MKRRRRGRVKRGGPEKCICPKCGYEEEHERGERCSSKECPECGGRMMGKW